MLRFLFRCRYPGLVLGRGFNWTELEVEATVAEYFAMLKKELRGGAYNKSEHRRALGQLLSGRSDTAIERKHQNISAILIEAKQPYIRGYKQLSQYQGLLADVVWDRMESDLEFQELVLRYAQQPVSGFEVGNVLGLMTSPPDLLEAARIALAAQKQRRARSIDYLAQEAENRQVGAGGEALVVSYERARLSSLGHGTLAEVVEHVAHTRGDGLGYDVLSFEPTGREKFIEVKTTKLGPLTPFYLSSNELSFSIEKRTQFSLYRVYDFVATPSIYSLNGSIEETCALNPAQYIAVPR